MRLHVTKPQFIRLLRSVALFYLLFCVLVTAFQRSLIYYPSREAGSALLARAHRMNCEPWRDAAGASIGWRSLRASAPAPANRIVVFHGNAGYALHRAHYFEGFGSLAGGRA